MREYTDSLCCTMVSGGVVGGIGGAIAGEKLSGG